MPESPFYRSSPIRPNAPVVPPRPGSGAATSASQSIEALRRKAMGGAAARVAPPVAPAQDNPAAKTPKTAVARTPARRATPAELVRRHELARSRAQLIERLTNPLLTLQETSLLLNVCPATVRRWANAGHLPHVRTEGNQRRFRWHDVQLLMPESVARRRG